uniref:MULE transposase domain-containing protein n=1 Tax=Ciona intestinalis TaxID=7719 RepID=H2XTE1_CIOIN
IKTMTTRQQPLIIGGDMRADTPGHCAKFGTYSFLELNINKIISTQLLQSNEIGNSNAMEKQGFIRCLEDLQQYDLRPHTVITDRHLQIAKYIREEQNDIVHHYDVWHLAKGLERKLLPLSNKHPELRPWLKSIIGHLYWAPASTPSDLDEDSKQNIVLAKWMSLTNHVVNRHSHDNEYYPSCIHEESPLDTKWLHEDDIGYKKLKEITLNTRFLKDVKKLSTDHQTSSIESFHSLILQFSPKMKTFSYKGMLCRQLLAALHYNENSDQEFILDGDDDPKLYATFPKKKHKEGTYSIRTKKLIPRIFIELLQEVLHTIFVLNYVFCD